MANRRLLGPILAVAAALAATFTPAAVPAAYADVPSGSCALAPTNAYLSEGVPTPSGYAPSTGTVATKMIFVDFPDAPANDTTTSLRDVLLPSGPNWFTTSSYGNLSLSVTAETSRFYRMPRNSTDYGWQRGLTYEAHQLYVTDALAAVGTSISFTGTQILYIVSTRAATAISFSPTFMGAVKAADGTVIGKTVTFGQDIWNVGWGGKVLNHETGHTMGLPDLYAFSGTGAHRYVGGWDLMGWIPGPAPDQFAWHKWKLGWLANTQVACVNSRGRYTQTLTPLEVAGGLKMVVVRTSTTKAFVAEVRSTAGVDSAACTTGVLVYSVDTSVATGNGPILVRDARPSSGGCGGHELNDAPYGVGMRFYDAASRTTIDVVNNSGDTYTVNVAYRVTT